MKGDAFDMKESTKKYLIEKYNSIPHKTKTSCLKFHYVYNGVHVNMYFDAFDKDSATFSIVLIMDKIYYYTPLNILNDEIKTEYLNILPPEILNKITVDYHLNDFYENMERHLLEDRPYFNSYNTDKFFVNTIRYSQDSLDLPFWWHLRHVRMSDEMLNKLNARGDISLNVLRKIQDKGFTLVRTGDPIKRKELTMILDQEGIMLK